MRVYSAAPQEQIVGAVGPSSIIQGKELKKN